MTTVHRLYVAEPLAPGVELLLNAERSRYVSRVLRARPGEMLVLFDGRGGEHAASVARVSRAGVTVSVGARREGRPESPLCIRLLQGVSRGDRMDWVVQKATELGVTRITPVLTELSVVRLDEARAARRAAHWTRIAEGACEQCGRNRLPRIDAPQSFASVLEEAASAAGARIALDAAARESLNALPLSAGEVALLIGPEGGLSEAERLAAGAAGFSACTLGPRILRTETAAVAAVTVLQSRLGDLR